MLKFNSLTFICCALLCPQLQAEAINDKKPPASPQKVQQQTADKAKQQGQPQSKRPAATAPKVKSIQASKKQKANKPQEKKSGKGINQVVTVFEDRGILTSEGTLIVEPSMSYTHSSSTVVAIGGYTVLPSLIVGLINITQAQRDFYNASISLRYGINSHFEIGVKLPYMKIDESIRERAILQDTPVDIIKDSSGSGLGDVEVSLNYQLTDGHNGSPYIVSNLRIKSTTGKSIFDVERRELRSEEDELLALVFEEQPTGSGFWSVQPGISLMYPTDPAVLYGSVNYLWNIKDDKGEENGGEVDPGDAVGFSFGIGFSVNEKTSFSLGYDHKVIGKTTTDLQPDGNDTSFDKIHSGQFLVGISQQMTSTRLNLSLGIGTTESSPDMQLTLRMPFAF